jgi:hypothetical protein
MEPASPTAICSDLQQRPRHDQLTFHFKDGSNTVFTAEGIQARQLSTHPERSVLSASAGDVHRRAASGDGAAASVTEMQDRDRTSQHVEPANGMIDDAEERPSNQPGIASLVVATPSRRS